MYGKPEEVVFGSAASAGRGGGSGFADGSVPQGGLGFGVVGGLGIGEVPIEAFAILGVVEVEVLSRSSSPGPL